MSDTLYENYLGTNLYYGSYPFAKATWAYQTFTALDTYTLTHVHIPLTRRTNTTTGWGTITLSIRATDVNGKPTGDALGAVNIDPATLSYSTYKWEEITLSAGVELTEGTKYAIVIQNGTAATTHSLGWYETYNEIVEDYYTGGSFGTSTNGTTWTEKSTVNYSYDVLFQTDHEEFLGVLYAEYYDDVDDVGEYFFQTFTPQTTHQITSVKLPIFRDWDEDTGEVTVAIYAVDVNHFPTGDALCSKELDISGITTEYSALVYTEFVFVVPANVEVDVEYAIVLNSTTTGQLKWQEDYSHNFYTRGRSGWGLVDGEVIDWGLQATNYDFLFAEYGIEVVIPTLEITADSIITATRTPVDTTEEFDFDAILKTVFTVPNRRGDYDPDKFWDEETQAWSSSRAISTRAGGRNKEYLIVVGCETIYVGGL